jgi:3-methyladenine DNA glycosylase Tag
LLERRASEIEAARKAKLEAERRERERLAALERERISRLLSDADRLRQAEAIRAYVAEVARRESVAVDFDAFERWRGWALEQADRIDPVASGQFLKAIDERP